MKWTVIVAEPALKQVARFPARDKLRIEAAIRMMAEAPFSGDTLKLAGFNDRWRRRVGDYRILFTTYAARTILVSAVVRRSSTTY
jgi:mRNA interferase RelE/StbE